MPVSKAHGRNSKRQVRGFGQRSSRIILVSLLILIVVGVGIFAYYEIKRRELISFLDYYHAYKPNFTYEQLGLVDVDKLPRVGGNLIFKSLVIAFTFNLPDVYDDVPYLRITYLSGPQCNSSQYPSSVNCQQMLLIIPDNNVTVTDRIQPLYAGPLNTFALDLYTKTGEHIEWHLYLFLATCIGTDDNGGLQD